MLQPIRTNGAKPASKADGAPTAAELIAAYDVPPHRHAAVHREFEILARRRNGLADGIMASINVSAARGEGRGLADRIRRVGGNVVRLVDSGRARLVLSETGIAGAMTIASLMLQERQERAGGAHNAEAIVGLKFIGQTLFDALVGGDDKLDAYRDDAHGYIDWLQIVHRGGPGDNVDAELFTEFETMCDLARLDHVEVIKFLSSVVALVDRDGPYVDVDATTTDDLIQRFLVQLELTDILDQLAADPDVLQAIAERSADRREARRRNRIRIAEAISAEPPLLPGLLV